MSELLASIRTLSAFALAAGAALLLACSPDAGLGQTGAANGGQRNSSTANLVDANLTNTYWTPLEINGELATLGTDDRELNMVLTGDESRVRGFSGCNQFNGSYEVGDDGQLTFGALASTRMACAEGSEQEQLFLGVLGQTRRFSISGQQLTLYDAADNAVLRFEAVYLR